MADTFTTLWNRLLLRAPAVGPALGQDLIRDAFNQLAERRPWSWLRKRGIYAPQATTVSGTVTTVSGSAIVTGAGTAFASTHTKKQIRIGGAGYPVFTIEHVQSATSIVLDHPWMGAALAGQSYAIHQCYVYVPSDFNSWYSVANSSANYRLWTNTTQADLDRCDAQRGQSGEAFTFAFVGYEDNLQGTIGTVAQVVGTGPDPVSMTTLGYLYPADSLYIIEITTGGAVGVADFRWRQDSGAWVSGVLTDLNAIDLSNGVQVYFPAGVYVLGDVFVIQCTAGKVTGLPRYEAWPWSSGQIYPYSYIARGPELTDSQPQLPPYIRGDVLLEMALRNCALIKGFDQEHPNPYFDTDVAKTHDAKAERMIAELEKKDDEVSPEDLWYGDMEWAPAPWADGSWMQRHAPVY